MPDSFGPPQYSLGLTYDRPVDPDHRVQLTTTDLYYVSWYIRSGNAEIKCNGQTFQAGAGQWVFMDPFTRRSHRLWGDPVLVSIRFRLSWRGLDYLPPQLGIRVVDGGDLGQLLAAAEALCEADQGELTPTSAAYFRRQSLFFGYLEQWRRQRETFGVAEHFPRDQRVFAIIEHLASHLSIQPIDYAGLQRAVGLSRAQINRIFQRETGMSPRQWMVARCLDEAQQRIRQGSQSLKEIAALLGFFDASHFTRWHRRQTGRSPTDWREMQDV